MHRRRWLGHDHEPTEVIEDVVAQCARLAGTLVGAPTRAALAARLEIGFAERVGRIVAWLDTGWQRARYEAALRRRPMHESVLEAAFRALEVADLAPEDRAAIARMLDLELDAAVPMLVQWLRTRRYDEASDAFVPRDDRTRVNGTTPGVRRVATHPARA
jgi:hypothetical protein